MGWIIAPNKNNVKIDIITLESGNKFIAAYIDPNDVRDRSFSEVLRRVSYAEK